MTNNNADLLLSSGTLYHAERPYKSGNNIKSSSKTPQEINNAAYEEYLTLLQERNRLLRKLKRKNKKQIALEKREQGFLLYLNGANADIDKNHQRYKTSQHQEGYHQNKNLLYHGNHHSSLQGIYSKRSRKNWLKSSMCIKTKDGIVWIGTPDDNVYAVGNHNTDNLRNKSQSIYQRATDTYKPEKKRHHRSLSNRLSECERALDNVKENLSLQEKRHYPFGSGLVQTSYLPSLQNLQGFRVLQNELTVIENLVSEVSEPTKMDKTNNFEDGIVELSSTTEKKTKRVLSATLHAKENNSDDKAIVPEILEAIEAENKSLSFDSEIQSSQVPHVDPSISHSKSKVDSGNWMKVYFEIFSNWGNQGRVGLTEVQFFDDKKHKMKVLPEISEIDGAYNMKGSIAELCNGKYKTVKERYMWSCALTNKPVKLMFAIEVPEASVLSAVKIWNYNRGVKELNIGVRYIRIFVEDELKYEGCLDKGCGNQVFDYSQTITLFEFPLPAAKQEETTTQEKSSNLSCPSSLCSLRDNEPDVKIPLYTDTQQRLTLLQMLASSQDTYTPTKDKFKVNMPSLSELNLQENVSHKRRLSEENKSSNSIQDVDTLEVPVPKSSSWLSSLPNIPNEVNVGLETETSSHSTQDERWDPNFKISLPDKSSSPSKTTVQSASQKQQVQLLPECSSTKPKWLENNKRSEARGTSSTGERPSWLSGVDIDISEPFENPLQSPSSLRSSSAKRLPSCRPRRYDSEPFLDMYCTKFNPSTHQKQSEELEEVSFTRSSTPREGSARYGRRAIPSPIPTSSDPKKSQATTPQLTERQFSEDSPVRKPHRVSELALEESWTSLHMFDQCHRGRIATESEGDVLDMYISVDKPLKNHMFLTPNTSEDDSVSVGSTDSDFIIPELPEGKEMIVNIRTTWGDFHYVGLNGIEIFSSSGEHVKVEKICANPADINILPEYSKDPRVVSNLIDGVYRTRDDMHLWLTPFTPAQDHLIILTFEKFVKVAMIRIWNYNKSRIHSFRGAKDIEITLDGHCIFKGEITRACGGIQGGTEAFGDTILFTTDDDILEAIAHHDETFTGFATEASELIKDDLDLERPRTGYLNSESERPLTSAQPLRRKQSIIDWDDSSKQEYMNENKDNVEQGVFCGQVLTLNLVMNWGDAEMIGLTGLEVMDEFGDPVLLKSFMLSTNFGQQHTETISRIIDGIHLTFTEAHMWAVPFREGQDHKIIVTFPQPIRISGIRLWNYNLSLEDSYRGVKVMHITLDSKILSPSNGFLIRKGPGSCHFDFAQEIWFKGPPSYSLLLPKVSNTSERSPTPLDDTFIQDYVAPFMPRGFIFQLHLFSSWGDPYYVGLNGLEVYDAIGNKIPLTENNIAAYPDSVNVLDGIENDVRTPDKLIDDINDTVDGRHMWLAPILPKVLNRVYIIFDFPVTVSMLKLWNYAKTPARGVKEFGLLVDDLLVYSNILAKASHKLSSSSDSAVRYHTILFTTDREITQKEKQSVLRDLNISQDVQLTNDCQVLHRCASGKPIDQAMRPFTSLPPKTPERSLRH